MRRCDTASGSIEVTKAEMEEHRVFYHRLIEMAEAAEKQHDYRKVVQLAVTSLQYVDGMMRFEQKYEDREFERISAIDLILEYAPLMFDSESLNAVESLLKSKRRIDRDTSDDLAEKLRYARRVMWNAHRVWNDIEHHPEVRFESNRTTAGEFEASADRIVGEWQRMGIIRSSDPRLPGQFSFCTRLDESVLAKCPSCGAIARAAKTRFMTQIACPKCRARDLFVILGASRTKARA